MADATLGSERDAMIALVVITYTAPMNRIEALTDAHRAYLKRLKAEGKVLASGPFDPRTGGALLLSVPREEDVSEIVAQDPYHLEGVARHEVHVWAPMLGAELFARVRPLDGKTAIVTGASSGIGEATARSLAREGARVAVVARRKDRLDALVTAIAAEGGRALAVVADVSRDAEVGAMIDATLTAFGRLDVLVNNAGIMLLAPVAESREEDWRHMVELNLLGAMVASKAALPHMKKVGGGHIVTVASVAARVANPSAAAYAATKFGIAAFCESLRREVYKDKIRVTVIEPGLVATELGEHITHPGMKASLAERTGAMIPLAAQDIAAAITYAVTQPAHVSVNEILVRPTDQER
jgi:NADP-dependent 3-hydroxy acid dehydrogenase YdfG/uncharacterized protein YciI